MKHRLRQDFFGDWVASISRLLSAFREHSSTTADHSDVLGKARELFVTEALQRFLPQALHFGSGQIVDEGGQLSKQIDVLIYRQDMPLLMSLAETNLYFAEGVVATVEVKSRLDTEELGKALDNCKSVKDLQVNYPGRGAGGNEYAKLRYHSAATYVFGYTGYKKQLGSLRKTLLNWCETSKVVGLEQLPEVIVAEGCVVVKNDHRCFDSNSFRRKLGYDPIFLAARDENPLRWLLHHLLWQIGGDLSTVLPNRSIAELLRRSHTSRKALEDRADYWGRWDPQAGDGGIVSLQEEATVLER